MDLNTRLPSNKNQKLLALLSAIAAKITASESAGHAPDSGLQRHSIGDTYPWATQVEGDLNPPIYRAIHLTSDPQRRGPLRSTSREAHEDAAEYARRDSLAAGVHLGGHTWADIFYAAGLGTDRDPHTSGR